MGSLIQTFTFDRNTFRRTSEESADSVAHHIEKVKRGDQLDKTASNIVGALGSYMGVFAKVSGKPITTGLADVFLKLYAANKADSWRWLVARSLWRFVVPNGTACQVNTPAQEQGVSFAFFHSIIQLLTHLSALAGEKRFLYFEEVCKSLESDANWRLNGEELFALVTQSRSAGNSGFDSQRSFLADLENKSDTERSEFQIPRDNFNGLFLKAFKQTGFFQFREGTHGHTVALALNPNLDPVLQRRLRFILDHPPHWSGTDWPSYMEIQEADLPQEVTADGAEEVTAPGSDPVQLADLVVAAKSSMDDAGLYCTVDQILRFTASLESKRFLILTGLAGSGKTKLAQAFTRWITPTALEAEPFSPGSKIESERTTYYVKDSNALAVEFWNAEQEDAATKVILPREMISEWAAYIRTHAIPIETPARDIREAVKGTSKFSDQLHSFETHLKAAAFALDRARANKLPAKCYEVVPVGADWTGNENVIGYVNGLDRSSYVTRPALEVILQANNHPDIPHFLILDEMNLSHVERYFADILSAIESEEMIHLHQDTECKANGVPIPQAVALPKNLFVIGTVNVDETTYMFSPKVLDRANVIEFRMEVGELESFLGKSDKPDLSKLDGKGASFGRAFVGGGKGAVSIPADVLKAYEGEMLLFFSVLRGQGAEFGYRVAHEAARFVYFYKCLANAPDGDQAWFPKAIDCVVVQKFLPKLHGSRARLGPLLKKLWFLCVNDATGRGADPQQAAVEVARSTEKAAEPRADIPAGAPYPLSAAKIARMWRQLNENGFASFAEA